MLTKGFSAALALAAATVVSAQTETACNPLDKTCPADPAFGNEKADCDWTSGACSVFDTEPGTTLTYGSQGAVFTINKQTDAPTIKTGKYLFFGRVDYEIQAAPGAGIVTSAVLQSDDLDEVDWEWVGADNTQAQTNYFGKGNTTTYTRGGFSSVSNPTGSVHTYSVLWTSQQLQWLIDNVVVRTLTYAEADGQYPQTPMQVKLGTWVAGCSTCAPGTVQWAGGHTDFSQAPFKAFYKSVAITDYAGGDSAPDGAIKEYIYGDNSGSYESIKVIKGDGSAQSSAASSTAASSTAASSKTKTSAAASTTKAESKTTMTTAASSPAGSPTGGSNSTIIATGTPTPSSGGSPTGSAPSVTKTGAAAQNGAAFGGALFAAAGLMLAQLF